MLGGINALHAAFPVDADEEYQTQGNLKIVFKEDLGWFSVFMSIGFSFYQPQIGSQTSSNADVSTSGLQSSSRQNIS